MITTAVFWLSFRTPDTLNVKMQERLVVCLHRLSDACCAKKGDGRHIESAEEPDHSDERVSVVVAPTQQNFLFTHTQVLVIFSHTTSSELVYPPSLLHPHERC